MRKHLDRRTSSYDEDHVSGGSPERSGSGKRYPCRFKDSHGCDKTFTTSGHASRHSKIHTAEKAVHCTFPSCQKKFTRADNMKQHLETHYKDRSRTSANKTTATKLTMPAGVRKPSSIARPASRNDERPRPGLASYNSTTSYVSQYSSPSYEPLASPTVSHYGALDMGEFKEGLPSQVMRTYSSSTGLDALAAVVSQHNYR